MNSYDIETHAPYIRVEVFSSGDYSAASRNCMGLMDTGAAITLIPQTLLERLKLEPCGSGEWVCGVDGKSISLLPYVVSIKIHRDAIESIEILAWEEGYALIGRDILNKYHICYDGLNEQFEIIG